MLSKLLLALRASVEGVVTERVIERAAAEGSALVLGPKAVLTPLGRDRARALGVTIKREAAC